MVFNSTVPSASYVILPSCCHSLSTCRNLFHVLTNLAMKKPMVSLSQCCWECDIDGDTPWKRCSLHSWSGPSIVPSKPTLPRWGTYKSRKQKCIHMSKLLKFSVSEFNQLYSMVLILYLWKSQDICVVHVILQMWWVQTMDLLVCPTLSRTCIQAWRPCRGKWHRPRKCPTLEGHYIHVVQDPRRRSCIWRKHTAGVIWNKLTCNTSAAIS